MTHLTIDALARLVGEDPTPDERRHLDNCEECRAEHAALVAQHDALAALPLAGRPAPWSTIEPRLRRAGLIGAHRARPLSHVAKQAAAAALLLAVGAASGVYVGGRNAPAESGPVVVQTAPARDEGAPAATVSNVDPLARVAAMAREAAPDTLSRLAALQAIVLTTSEALRGTPGDELIRGYHRVAKEQRDALVRRLAFRNQVASRWF